MVLFSVLKKYRTRIPVFKLRERRMILVWLRQNSKLPERSSWVKQNKGHESLLLGRI